MEFELLPTELKDKIIRELDNRTWLHMAQTSTSIYEVCYISHKERLKKTYLKLLSYGIYPVIDAVSTDNIAMLMSIIQYSKNWQAAFKYSIKFAAYNCMNWIYENRKETLGTDFTKYVNLSYHNTLTLKWFHARGHVGTRYLVKYAIIHNCIGVLEEAYTKKEHYFKGRVLIELWIYDWFKSIGSHISSNEGINGETFIWLIEHDVISLNFNILHAALEVHAWDVADAYQQSGGKLNEEQLPQRFLHDGSIMNWIFDAYGAIILEDNF